MCFSALLLSYLSHAVPLLLLLLPAHVTARFCEGGHICSLPRECCTQGCCPPYQGGPRQLPPPSEHVLNLFFISHWFFWCVVVAIILAILCAYSLWKKRRTLCGWGLPDHHTQSEGDSAGSCYAPPQYSRCNSFHHPPPPYTEVTSKPDLYPLVFTCNSDNGKGNGSSYLMVQYFRNYIVRPAGSLSAASTVDSLSSSFICNANEANTLVPPPYSRAASPDMGLHYGHAAHMHANPPGQGSQQQPQESLAHAMPSNQYALPRSASQLMYHSGVSQAPDYHGPVVYAAQSRTPHYATVALNTTASGGMHYNTRLHASESSHFSPDESGGESSRSGSGCAVGGRPPGSQQQTNGFLPAHSDQRFRHMANSSSSLSDIFVSNSCATGLAGSGHTNANSSGNGNGNGNTNTNSVGNLESRGNDKALTIEAASLSSLALTAGGMPAIYSKGCIKHNPLHCVHHTGATQFGSDPAYNACSAIGGLPLASESSVNGEYRDLQLLRRSLETCCQLLQQQQGFAPTQAQAQAQASGTQLQPGLEAAASSSAATVTAAALRSCSYVTSATVSGVSSLANIGTPGSPPQATSPTGEMRDIIQQIRQLQASVSYEELLLSDIEGTFGAVGGSGSKPPLQQTLSTPSSQKQLRPATLQQTTAGRQQAAAVSSAAASKCKKAFSPKPNKALYIPMDRCMLKSPVSGVIGGSSFFVSRGRARKGWISRSAPTTPGTGLPPNRLGDDSPLLNEHDEDAEDELK